MKICTSCKNEYGTVVNTAFDFSSSSCMKCEQIYNLDSVDFEGLLSYSEHGGYILQEFKSKMLGDYELQQILIMSPELLQKKLL